MSNTIMDEPPQTTAIVDLELVSMGKPMASVFQIPSPPFF